MRLGTPFVVFERLENGLSLLVLGLMSVLLLSAIVAREGFGAVSLAPCPSSST